jgi:hypothetical protein
MPQVRVLRIANPLVRAILGSRAHPLLSGRLLVLAYRGRRSGQSFAIPLLYAETAGGDVVVLALRPDKLWWRSFRDATSASITLRGANLPVTGVVTDGEPRTAAMEAFVARHPYAAKRVPDSAPVVVLVPTR